MSDIRERMSRPITPELHDRIRRLWIRHSIAEDRREIPGLLDTLSDDCVYEIMPTGQRWEGHAGARAFYEGLLGAFPDVKFVLEEIVIGPQGVWEEARMTGTHLGTWAGLPGTGNVVSLRVLIYFPWNPAVEKFDGEKVYFDRADLS